MRYHINKYVFLHKTFKMKKVALYFLIIYVLSIISSCGIYSDQCEGVAENNMQKNTI